MSHKIARKSHMAVECGSNMCDDFRDDTVFEIRDNKVSNFGEEQEMN